MAKLEIDENIVAPKFTMLTSPHDHDIMAVISEDGEVTINWEHVEVVVASPDFVDPINLAYARLMIAIRDKTYKETAS